MTSVANTVMKVLSDVFVQKGLTPPDLNEESLTLPFEEFGLDSMDKLDFAMGLEDAFGTVFVTSEMLKCRTLFDIIAFAERSRTS